MSGALHPLTKHDLIRLGRMGYKEFDEAVRDFISPEEYADILRVARSPTECVVELQRRYPQMEEGVRAHEDDGLDVDRKTAAAGPDK